mgnify:CR=1 FL=1|jgi:predicted transcriptional regulator
MEQQALVFVLGNGLDTAEDIARHLRQANLGGIMVTSHQQLARAAERKPGTWPILLAEARAAFDFLERAQVAIDAVDLILIVDPSSMSWANERLGHRQPFFLVTEPQPAEATQAVEALIRGGLQRRRLRASRLMLGVAQALARDWDQVVTVLLYGAPGNKLTLTRLSLDSGINMSTLRRIVTRLESRGMVVVTNAPEDRRVREVTLTPLGRQTLEAELLNS